LRTIVADNATYSTLDIVITPIFIFAVYLITKTKNKMTEILAWIGKYSVYMWLTHTFFCYYYFQKLITFSKFSTIMYLELVGVSLVTAMIFGQIEKRIDKYLVVLKEKNYGSD
jgi:hypothetical protein